MKNFFQGIISSSDRLDINDSKQNWLRRNNSNQVSCILKPRLFFNYDSETPTNNCCSSVKRTAKSNKKSIISHGIDASPSDNNIRRPKGKMVFPAQIKKKYEKTSGPRKTLTTKERYFLETNKIKRKENYKKDQFPVTESTHSLETLKHAREIVTYSPESTFLRRLCKEAKQLPREDECGEIEDPEELKTQVLSNLEFTNRRKQIEEEYNIKKHAGDIYYGCEPTEKHKKSKTHQYLDTKKLHDLNKFRKNNYFECHSLTNLNEGETVPDHKCVYKYALNERLFPEPLNVDHNGVSRCSICNLPINAQKTNTSAGDLESLDLNLESYEWEYKKRRELLKSKACLDLVDREIEITIPLKSGYENLIIKQLKKPKLNQSESKSSRGRIETNMSNYQIKPIVPVNSFALRFQKGVTRNF